MKVGLYLRVSTVDQAKEGYSIGEQEARLRDYSKAMQWEIHKIYIDPGYSGGNIDRPGLQELIKDVEAGILDKVVVYKLDRLSRSQYDTLFLIQKVFLPNDCDFVSMTENFSTGSPLGRAMIGFLAVFAQLEKDKLNERMIMGKEARAKAGLWNGGTEPIGFDYNTLTDMLEDNEYEIMQLNELLDLVISGETLRGIERLFSEKGYKHKHGLWTPTTMRRVLRNPLYLGYINYKGKLYKGKHNAVWNKEKHNKAIEILDRRLEAFLLTGIKPGAQTTYLGGMLHCKHCGGKYSKTLNSRYKEGKPKVYWYSCYSRCKKVKKMIKDPNCKNKNWKMVELDEAIFNEIRKIARNPEIITEMQGERQEQREEPNRRNIITNEIKKIENQISRFMDLYGEGVFSIEQISSKVNPLNEQKRNLQRELERINADTGAITIEQALEYIAEFEDAIEEGDLNNIRYLLESLIYYIELDNDDIFIHWKFA